MSIDIDMPSDRSSNTTASLHHRRPPADRSVSLRHGIPNKTAAHRARSHEPSSASSSADEVHRRPTSSPSSLKPLIGKDDSGESSNAERWFEKSNNHVAGHSPSFADNSPPFFLQNSSSEETPPDVAAIRDALRNGNASGSMPLRNGLLHIGTDNSSTEDFRSVIDDLTIANKKLKKKLKSYQKLQDSHLKDQKLFEVRVHGLPTNKKKELEEMLRKFAMGLQGAPDSNAFAGQGTPAMPPGLLTAKSGSSSTSNPFADSAYASASASGQGSSSRSTSDNKKKAPSASAARSRHQNIHTYLHDIPEGLMPRYPAVMSEKTKKKLIVRRLEQIFAGKGAVTGNQQPQQQEEVSQSAARADRQQFFEDKGRNAPLEGIREARIKNGDGTATKDFAERPHDSALSKGKESDLAENLPNKQVAGLDQRPTRPLDLDPHRAQVPSDNIDYIRHLGFSPKHFGSSTPPEDGHGWIYLNLLANMAQLHTINVTPDYVRRAVQDHSKKFELSSDGRKIRWKGGKSVTITSSDGDTTPSAMGTPSNGVSTERGSPNKRLKTSKQGSVVADGKLSRDDKIAWTPLFHHRGNEDDSDDSVSSDEEDITESAFPLQQTGDSSGMTSSGIKTTGTKKLVKQENGPIIFYNNAKFCTDLSGDAKAEDVMTYNAFLYHNLATQPVGTAPSKSSTPIISDTRGPLIAVDELPEAMDIDDNPTVDAQELNFPDSSPMTSSQEFLDPKAIKLEVSGLGGVYPADNFTINVKSTHARRDDMTAPQTADHEMPSRYPATIAKVLAGHPGRKARTAFHKQVIGTHHEDHAPTELPDASCFMPAGDTTPEDDDMDDADDVISVSPVSPYALAPSAAPQPIELDFESEESEASGDDDGYESDGSLDLLAVARELDPETVRLREREYDAQLAERLAEEIPAGSSAATAGGGSGFASPGSGVDREEWESARKAAKAARREERLAGLKRRRSEVNEKGA